MSDIDITLYLNEYRVRALADALGSQTAETVEDKLAEAFDMLYQEYVPDEQRASIEATIEREDAAEQARLEAARRFAVYHIRENGEDCHFTSDYFLSPMQAAYTAQSDVLENKITELRIERRTKITDSDENEMLEELKMLNDILKEVKIGIGFDAELFEQTVDSITVESSELLTFHLAGGISLPEKIREKGRCYQA